MNEGDLIVENIRIVRRIRQHWQIGGNEHVMRRYFIRESRESLVSYQKAATQ